MHAIAPLNRLLTLLQKSGDDAHLLGSPKHEESLIAEGICIPEVNSLHEDMPRLEQDCQ